MAKNRIANYTNEGKTVSTSIVLSAASVLRAANDILGTTTIWTSGTEGSKITSVKISKTGNAQNAPVIAGGVNLFLILKIAGTSYILKEQNVASGADYTAGLTTLFTAWDTSFAALTDANSNKYLNVPTNSSIEVSFVCVNAATYPSSYGNATIYDAAATLITVTSEDY